MCLGFKLLIPPLMVLSLALLTTQCASDGRVLPTPTQLASTTSDSSALSLSIDDIIAQSASQEAEETAFRKSRKGLSPAQPARQVPKDGSLNSLLNWAIEHSDPSVIKEQVWS